jgi:hypothetical protein
MIVKRRARQAGVPADLLSGHSLRAGYATAAARAGIEERKIGNVTRHKNLPVLRSYIRAATAFDDVGEVLQGVRVEGAPMATRKRRTGSPCGEIAAAARTTTRRRWGPARVPRVHPDGGVVGAGGEPHRSQQRPRNRAARRMSPTGAWRGTVEPGLPSPVWQRAPDLRAAAGRALQDTAAVGLLNSALSAGRRVPWRSARKPGRRELQSSKRRTVALRARSSSNPSTQLARARSSSCCSGREGSIGRVPGRSRRVPIQRGRCARLAAAARAGVDQHARSVVALAGISTGRAGRLVPGYRLAAGGGKAPPAGFHARRANVDGLGCGAGGRR